MKRTLIPCLWACAALSLAADPYSLTRTEKSITVKNAGAEFIIPAAGDILIMPEEKRLEKPIANVLLVSDGSRQFYVLPDGRDNRFTVLEDSDMKKVVRADLSLSETEKGRTVRPVDFARLVVYYQFVSGIPGVAVTERITALKPFSLHKFNVGIMTKFTECAVDSTELKPYPAAEARKGGTGSKEYILGRKADGSRYYLSHDAKAYMAPGMFFVPFRVIIPSNGISVAAGNFEETSVVIGRVLRDSDVERLNSLRKAAGRPGEKTPDTSLKNLLPEKQMFAEALKKDYHGEFNEWDRIPICIKRGETRDYRPIATNTWSGPDDLSFTFKCAYDSEYLYVLIDVTDDVLRNTFDGDSIWLGDSVQFGIDALCDRDGRSFINFAVAQAGKKPVIHCFGHPDKSFVGDVSGIIKNKSRLREKGIVYDLAIPWKFLKPFDPVRGKFGFNFAVIDQDDGTNYENWMGITDGVFGGRNQALYYDLNLQSVESALASASKTPVPQSVFPSKILFADSNTKFSSFAMIPEEKLLPARLKISFNGKETFSFPLKKGFNNFSSELAANRIPSGNCVVSTAVEKDGRILYETKEEISFLSRSFLDSLTGKVDGEEKALSRKVAQIVEKTGKQPEYLKACAAMFRYFIDFARSDLSAREVMQDQKKVKVEGSYKLYVYDRLFKNLSYLDRLFPKLLERADAILNGTKAPVSFPVYPSGVQPVIADGGFKVDGKELLLIGPNTWTNVRGFRDEQLPVIAQTGMNYINVFYVGGKRRSGLIDSAEKNGLYFSYGASTAELFNQDTITTPYFKERVENPNHYLSPMTTISPNMVFSIAQGEQFPRKYEMTKEWSAEFQAYLRKKFGTIEKLNHELSTDFKKIEEIDYSKALRYPALKYESFVYRLSLALPRQKTDADFKRRYFGRPVTTHYSTNYNITGLDPLVVLCDFEGIWNIFDIVGFDGGVGVDASSFAVNFSKGTIDCDLARSFYPEKPIANNENHIIVDGVYQEYTEEETYVSNILTYFHGLNAGSIWVWVPSGHTYGEYAFTRANTYHATLQCAIDLRRFPEEIAAFRKQENPPFRILHSLPSMTDRDVYVKSLYGVYEGSFFTGWPVRFLSERMIEKNDFKDAGIIVVPEAKRVSGRTFAALAAFVEKGGKVLTFGKTALTCDEYGKPVPEREKTLAKFIRKPSSGPTVYAEELGALLRERNLTPPVMLAGKDGKIPFGVEYRSAKDKNGKTLLYVLNLNKSPVEIRLPGKWTDLLNGTDFPETAVLKSLELHLLKKK